jgi:cytochrome oxidase Cu insertion factor (SCO1/SenC/PrrC family)
MSSPILPEPLPDRPASKGTTVMILSIIIALSVVVTYNYLLTIRRQHTAQEIRLPMQGRVETDLPAWVDQNGVTRHLEQLRGKVFVVAYLYTTCPQGCAGVAEKMSELQKEFASDPNFHLLSISLDAEHDRPDVLKAWLDQKGFGGENWWFLTSPEPNGDAIRTWMTKTFRIGARKKSPEQLAANPVDKYEHNLVMVLVDAKGNIRTPTDTDMVYWPFHEAFDYGWYPRPIREDIIKLLAEARQPAP